MFSSRKELKARAQQSMAFTKPSYLIIGIIMVIVVNAESWLGAILGAGTAFTYGTYEELMAGVEAYMDNLPLALTLASLVLTMFVSVIQFGFKSYCLCISRGEKEVGIDELVSGFQCFWKVLGLNILTGLFTALWTLLFIIPGIIAIYRYRMAPQLMLDHPDWSITKCSAHKITGWFFGWSCRSFKWADWFNWTSHIWHIVSAKICSVQLWSGIKIWCRSWSIEACQILWV